MDVEDVRKKSKALSSKTRLNLIQLIGRDKYTVSQLKAMFEQNYEGRTRETIYRELEKLVDAGILSKEYHNQRKKLFYSAELEEIKFKLV
jgi:Fe2+ or Zn2+ uptake regulation protein